MRSFKAIAECAAVATASLMAYVCTAGTEVVQNGDFEDGSATDQAWGSYAGNDGYNSPGWSVTVHGGLAKPDGTWMNNLLDVGRLALFLQSSVDYTSSASQSVVVDEPGTYRISFKWAARAGHAGQNVEVWFDNNKLDTISTTDTSLQYWYKDVEISAAGSYLLDFEALKASGDVATVIDSVSMRKICKYTWTGGGQTARISDAGNWGGTPGRTQLFNSTDYLVFDKAADVEIDSDVMVDGIQITGNGAVTFTGSRTITIERGIISESPADCAFNCPVKFLGTYFAMQNGSGAVKFPGGVTAKYPDATLRTIAGTKLSRTLQGDFTFTEDWTAALCGTDADRPWTVPAGSTVHGQVLSGLQTSHRSFFRLDEGASAYFSCVTNGWDIGDIDIDGYMEVSGDMIVQTYNSSSSNESHFGRRGNIGTLKANRIAKSGHSVAGSYIPNLVVGAGGMGVLVQDYYWRFMVDTTITAAEDFNFLGLQLASNHADWGINFNTRVMLTVNVPEGITVTCGIGVAGEGSLRKTGAGTLVMTDTFNGVSDYIKNYCTLPAMSAGTIVDEGVLQVEAAGQLGSAPVKLAAGTLLKIATGVSFTNRIVGEGTVQLANGVTLANSGAPWNAAAVEFAAAGDAVTVTAPEGTAAPFTFLTGVDAADLSRFAYAGGTLTVKGGALMLADAAAATDYVWNGGANGDWAAAGSWLVGGAAAAAAPGASDTIRFENGEPVTVTGSSALSVTKIVTSTGAEVTFDCPVAFAGTYNVLNATTAPNFAGGATATVPDDSLTEANMPSHELKGNINFTANWTIPVQPNGRPFVLTAGSTLTGRILSGVTYDNTNPVLRIDEGAVATFDSVDVAGKLVFFLNGGNLVSIGDITTGGVGTPRDFGYYGQGNVGTVEARGIYKSVTGYGNINIYTTNMVVGAGGFGMYRKDYAFVLCVDTKLTAKDDFTIYQPVAEDGPKDGDWGLNMNGFTFTLDTAGHTVVFDSYVNSNAAVLIKEGEGEMIMQSRQKQHTGGTILKAGLTTVKTSGALGYGTTTVKSGATLAFSADQMLAQAYPVVVNDGGMLVYTVGVAGSSTLTLNAGAILKPTQGAVFSVPDGRLALPGVGSVKIDLRDFSFVDGIANAILGGAAAGDETKFTALVPAGVVGAFSVSDGFLYYTPTSGGSAAADLFWHPVGDAVWSTSIAAWTNAAGSQVTFTPYANATIADAATISLPEDIPGNDVTIATDGGDVTLTGAGTLGGIGNVTKRGSGTLTLDGANFDGQNFTIAEGKVVLGGNAGAYSLGTDSGSVGGTVTVQDGAQFNVNTQNTAGNATDERFEISQLKTFVIAGDGPDGRGAIVNDCLDGRTTHNAAWGPALRRVELSDDATIGGADRFDVRVRTGTAATSQGGIFGPGKQLTIKCPGFFGLVSLPIDVGSVLVTGGGVFRPESPTSISIPSGITLDDGTLHGYAATYPATVPVFVGEGGGTIDAQSGTTTINAPVLVADGASLTLQGGSTVHYESGITNAGSVTVSAGSHDIKGGAIAGAGEWTLSGGSLAWYQTATLDSPKTLNLTGGTFFYGKETSGLGKLNQKLTVNATGGTFAFNAGAPTTITSDDVEISGKPSTIRLYGKNDASMVVRLEGIKATADTIGSSSGGGNANYTFGNGVDFTTTTFLVNQAANCLSSIIRVEEGASLTVGNNLTIGDSAGANEYRMIVDGGRVVCEGTSPLHMAYQANAGYLDFLSGEMEVPGIWCRIGWFSPLTYDEKFTMDGGTLSITGAHATNPAIGGYTRFKPFIQFNNGKIVSLGNWAVQQMLAVSFGDKAGGHVEFDIADKTVDWRTGLIGAADVTLKGSGTFNSGAGAAEFIRFQGVTTGEWTIENTGVNDLYGSSGFLGGLHLKENVAANIRIGGSNLVEAVFLQTGSGKFNEACTWSNAYPFACNDLTTMHHYSGSAQISNCNMMWQGQFYADTAGIWTFAGSYDDSLHLEVDGLTVFHDTDWQNVTKGTIELTVGWHDFRIVQYQAGGGWGCPASGWQNVMNVGFAKSEVDNTAASSYMRFDADHIPLRAGPATGSGGNVNWHVVHQKDNWKTRTDWTFESVTNKLSMLDIYNVALPETIGNSVHMFDGWVFVKAAQSGDWAVHLDFDDSASLAIDGVDSGATGANSAEGHAGAISGVTPGWHRFELRVCDTGGNWGPWSGTAGQAKNPTATVTVNDKTWKFDETQFRFSAIRPAEYAGLDGNVQLDEGSVLANTATKACPIWGTLKGTGTLSGPFAFAGDANCWDVADASATRATLPAVTFADATAETFAGLKNVKVTFDAKPVRYAYYLTDAIPGLAAVDVSGVAVAATDGTTDYTGEFVLAVKRDRLALVSAKPASTILFFR